MSKTVKATGLRLRRSRDEPDAVAYLELPTYAARRLGKASKSIRLFDLVGKYKGPDVILDFDDDGVLIGIEVLA